MYLINRLKALVPTFTTQGEEDKSDPEKSLMPDTGTQTPEKWAHHATLSARKRDGMSAQMEPRAWSEGWKLIESMAESSGHRLARHIGERDRGRLDQHASETRRTTSPVTRPLTPGSGNGEYDDGPTVMTGLGGADVEMMDVDGIGPNDQKMQDVAAEDSSGYVPTPGRPTFDDDVAMDGSGAVMDRGNEQVDNTPPPPADLASPIDLTFDTASGNEGAKDSQASNFTSPDQQLLAEASAATPQQVYDNPRSELTLPAIPSSPDSQLEQLLPGIISESATPAPPQSDDLPSSVWQHDSPSDQIAAEIAHFGERDEPAEISASDLSFDLDGSATDLQGTQPIQLQANNVVAEQQQFFIDLSSPVPVTHNQQAAQVAPSVLRGNISPSVNDHSEPAAQQQSIAPHITSASQDLAQRPTMPVRLPPEFHGAILEEAVKQGLTPEEQEGVMATLRGVERVANINDVKFVKGAIEVDAMELDGPSSNPVEPPSSVDSDAFHAPFMPAPAVPSAVTNKGKGTKRKGDNEAGPTNKTNSKKAKPAKDIQAFTDEEWLQRGWKFRPKSDLESMKAPELRDLFRTIQSQKRWWNGLNKGQVVGKIMEWQNSMKELQESHMDMDGEVEDQNEDDTNARDHEGSVTVLIKQERSSTAGRKSQTPAPPPATPADQLADANSFVRGSSSSLPTDRSLFYDPGSQRRKSTPLLDKLEAARSDPVSQDINMGSADVNDASDAMATRGSSSKETSTRRSRSKTADSGKHVLGSKEGEVGDEAIVKGGKKGGRGRKSMEPVEGPKERKRSLRSRTASVAPESYK